MITLDYQSKDPIYLQIKNRIAELVMLGVYPPGTQLPSVRSLAGELGINPNTIQRAYRELEAKGFIYSMPGKGSFVSGSVDAADSRKQELLGQFDEVSQQLIDLGCTAEELSNRLKEGKSDD